MFVGVPRETKGEMRKAQTKKVLEPRTGGFVTTFDEQQFMPSSSLALPGFGLATKRLKTGNSNISFLFLFRFCSHAEQQTT
mgnify:CR=1 FL=1